MFDNMNPMELLVVLGGAGLLFGVVILLIFGNRLPSVMQSLGKSVTQFKNRIRGIGDDLEVTTTPAVPVTSHSGQPRTQE